MAKTIVLADDEQFISSAYSDGLTRRGFKIITAIDGIEAIEKIRKHSPDLVLLDLVMPRKNGFEVLKDIKADANLAKIPVIMLSNLSKQSDAEEAKKLGAADFIVKSDISLDELSNQCKELIG